MNGRGNIGEYSEDLLATKREEARSRGLPERLRRLTDRSSKFCHGSCDTYPLMTRCSPSTATTTGSFSEPMGMLPDTSTSDTVPVSQLMFTERWPSVMERPCKPRGLDHVEGIRSWEVTSLAWIPRFPLKGTVRLPSRRLAVIRTSREGRPVNWICQDCGTTNPLGVKKVAGSAGSEIENWDCCGSPGIWRHHTPGAREGKQNRKRKISSSLTHRRGMAGIQHSWTNRIEGTHHHTREMLEAMDEHYTFPNTRMPSMAMPGCEDWLLRQPFSRFSNRLTTPVRQREIGREETKTEKNNNNTSGRNRHHTIPTYHQPTNN